MKRHILTIAALFLSCTTALGRSTNFPLMTEIQMLGRLVGRYHAEEGVYPESWAEVEGRFGLLKSRSGLDHFERFAFVPEVVPVPYPTDARIIFISREPFRPPTTRDFPLFYGHYKTVGARGYLAAIADGDEVFLQHISPQRAAQLFKNAGVDLPAPSGFGLYPHERAHRARSIVIWFGLAGACVLIYRAIAERRKARRSEQARVAG